MKKQLVCLCSLALALGASCKRPSAAGLTLAGSTSIQPFAEKWAEAYRATHPKVELLVQGGGSTAGVQAALGGAAQIGMCSRELHPDEAAKLQAIVIARDGQTIVVHPLNPVGDLTVEQVRGIFAGELRNWSKVGGPDKRITVVTREMGSGSRGAFEELAMKGKAIAASALVQDSQGAVRQMVSTDASAIGYVSHGIVDSTVKPLKLGGVAPGPESVRQGQYPLVRPFLFLTRGEPTGPAKAFIDWVLGPEGQALAAKEGLFPPK